jgi:hypothetical protein
VENQKKDGYLGDPARGQADPRSAAEYTMDLPGPVICMYVCTGTVFHVLKLTDLLVVTILIIVRAQLCMVAKVGGVFGL